MALKHYKNSDSTVFNDAKALFDLNKNISLNVSANFVFPEKKFWIKDEQTIVDVETNTEYKKGDPK